MIEIDTKGQICHGSIIINCKTKRDDSDDKIITRNLEVSLEGVSLIDVQKRLESQVAVDIQNRKIRKVTLSEAREWTNKKILWSDIYTRTTTVRVPTKAEMLEKAKTNVEYRKSILEMAKELEEME